MKTEFENDIWEIFLKDAVIEHTLKELENYPLSEIQKTDLPPYYVRAMQNFIWKYRYYTRTKSIVKYTKKAASIALIIMGISFSVLLQFDVVRAACQNVITTVYERYIEFIYTPFGDVVNYIPDLKYIPDGFYIKEQYNLDDTLFLILENANSEKITLSCFQEKYTLQHDNEHYEIETIQVNEQQGTYFQSLDSNFENVLIWNTEKMYYMLSSDLPKDTLLKIAENIK